MSLEQYIPLKTLCTHYKVEMSFFNHLDDFGFITIKTIERAYYVHKDETSAIEKIIRMHQELDINFEGIDTILNLLEKIEALQTELIQTKNRLNLYEDY
jgi:hypothetical protein